MSNLNVSLMEGEDQESLEEILHSLTQFITAGRVKVVDSTLWANKDEPRNFCQKSLEPNNLEEEVLSGRAATFYLKASTAAGERLLLIHRPVGQTQKLFYRVSDSPAALGHRLYLASLNSPIILPKSYGYIEERQDKKLLLSMQVLEVLPNLPTLGETLAKELNGADSAKREKIFLTLAHQLAIIHSGFFYHPALRPGHILVLPNFDLARDSFLEESQFILLPNDKMRFLKKFTIEYRAVNLYQFYRYALCDASEKERFRFIESYCNYQPADSLDAEDLYRRVNHHFNERIAAEEK